MFYDPWYGLENPVNYFRWNQLKVAAKSNITEYNNNVAWKSELRSAFNLVWDQMQTVSNNWNNYYRTQSTAFFQTLPVNGTFVNPFGAAYWQWANSYVSMAQYGLPTMAQVYPGQYSGYYEIGYWHTDYFDNYVIQWN